MEVLIPRLDAEGKKTLVADVRRDQGFVVVVVGLASNAQRDPDDDPDDTETKMPGTNEVHQHLAIGSRFKRTHENLR